jgi:hypothetical protein
MNLKNIDMICAKYGSQIGKKEDLSETLINKSLGILQEEGIYAFFLFLASRGKGEKKQADCIQDKTIDLLQGFFQNIMGDSATRENILQIIRDKLVEDLNDLFLAKDLIERTLVYARYHLKAKGDK